MKKLGLFAIVGVFLLAPSAYADKSRNWWANSTGAAATQDGYGWSAVTNKITAKKIADWVFCNNCDLDVSFDALRGSAY